MFKTTEEYGYRIPVLSISQKGTLLAFCERRVGLHDHAQNDIVLRRSLNGGKSWQPLQVLAEEGGDSLNDPCVVAILCQTPRVAGRTGPSSPVETKASPGRSCASSNQTGSHTVVSQRCPTATSAACTRPPDTSRFCSRDIGTTGSSNKTSNDEIPGKGFTGVSLGIRDYMGERFVGYVQLPC